MDQAFINAVFARPPRVLRRRLMPFTLGHWKILAVLESPLAPFAAGDATADDLALAVRVCSRPWRKALVRPSRLAVALWAVTCAGLSLAEECERFRGYVDAYTRYPSKWDSENDRSLALPIPWQIAWTLLGKWPEREVWDMPAIDALLWCACQDERNGGRFLTDDDRRPVEIPDSVRLAAEAARDRMIAEGKLAPPENANADG